MDKKIVELNVLSEKEESNPINDDNIINLKEVFGQYDIHYKRTDIDRYRLIKAIVPISSIGTVERYYILDTDIPCFQANEWLKLKSKSINTGRKYATVLNKFFNYLEKRNFEYWEATNLVVEDYINYLLYEGEDNTLLIESKIRYKTISDTIMVIKHFYKWLSKRINRVGIEFVSKKNLKKYSFLYGQIWEGEYEDIIEKRLKSMPSSKEYIKWYTEQDKEKILDSFKTLRDKAIFLCTVDGGMRIDEVISIKLSTYSSENKEVTPTRSKNGYIRTVSLSDRTCEIIDNYIFSERSDAEVESGVFNEYLFINLRKGKTQGKEINYHNYYQIFKRKVEKAGFPVEEMRLHSGRSTKTMELLKHQVLYPEDNLTDGQINTIMGWSSPESINPYKDHRNTILGKAAHEKIQKKKQVPKEEEKGIDNE